MAINSRKYVDISTTFPSAGTRERALGGLVFTTDEMTLKPAEDTGGSAVGAAEPLMLDGRPASYVAGAYQCTDNVNWEWDSTTGMYKAVVSNKTVYPPNAHQIKMRMQYYNGDVLGISLDAIATVFGLQSKVYKFALGYYSYISPSGRYASQLKLYKVTEESLVQAFLNANNKTNNFGSFTFLAPDSQEGSSDDSSADWNMTAYVEVANANARLDTKYLFVVNDIDKNSMMTDVERFYTIRGVCFLHGSSDVSAYMPMAILGSTDYANGQVVSFMFKQFGTETPSVESDEDYVEFNAARINFYGYTQTNGQTLAFYQRGFNTDGQDTAVYCNELWFKAACETALLTMISSRERLPANALGIDLVKLEIAQVGSQATTNGAFMQKVADATDLRQIREIVIGSDGDETDVNDIVSDLSATGFSTYAYLSQLNDPEITGPQSEPIIAYYVFYGTADSVRFIKGNNILL